jgi:hypothetical protein
MRSNAAGSVCMEVMLVLIDAACFGADVRRWSGFVSGRAFVECGIGAFVAFESEL